MEYIIYNKYTGLISSTGSCPLHDYNNQSLGMGEEIMEGIANDSTQKINLTTMEVVEKTVLPSSINKTSMLADGADLIVISNLPNPTDVNISGERGYTISDGFIEFTIDTPGEYKIICHSRLYLDVEYTINAS
jgi:hypothetical protein